MATNCSLESTLPFEYQLFKSRSISIIFWRNSPLKYPEIHRYRSQSEPYLLKIIILCQVVHLHGSASVVNSL